MFDNKSAPGDRAAVIGAGGLQREATGGGLVDVDGFVGERAGLAGERDRCFEFPVGKLHPTGAGIKICCLCNGHGIDIDRTAGEREAGGFEENASVEDAIGATYVRVYGEGDTGVYIEDTACAPTGAGGKSRKGLVAMDRISLGDTGLAEKECQGKKEAVCRGLFHGFGSLLHIEGSKNDAIL